MNDPPLVLRAREAKAWLLDAAFPVWARYGFDPQTGLFHEKLGADLQPTPGPRRVRVQARQTYVFALAGRMGWDGPWAELVAAGFETLNGPARSEGGAVGHLLDAKGKMPDARRDLYDIAFAIFACAHAAATAPQALRRADEILAFLDREWKSPNGGFLEGEVEAPYPRWQNPRMHLFEAAMAMLQAGGAPRWRYLAEELARLGLSHFYDAEHGVLREWFEADWKPAEGEKGRILEPGHHFEWAWLLARWRDVSGAETHAQSARLYQFAQREGIGPHGLAVDEIWLGGGLKTATARLWPQTERLKAALVHYEGGGGADDAVHAYDCLKRYLDHPVEGLWRDRLREDGEFVDEPAPASSFYHIALALAELIRIAEIS